MYVKNNSSCKSRESLNKKEVEMNKISVSCEGKKLTFNNQHIRQVCVFANRRVIEIDVGVRMTAKRKYVEYT